MSALCSVPPGAAPAPHSPGPAPPKSKAPRIRAWEGQGEPGYLNPWPWPPGSLNSGTGVSPAPSISWPPLLFLFCTQSLECLSLSFSLQEEAYLVSSLPCLHFLGGEPEPQRGEVMEAYKFMESWPQAKGLSHAAKSCKAPARGAPEAAANTLHNPPPHPPSMPSRRGRLKIRC